MTVIKSAWSGGAPRQPRFLAARIRPCISKGGKEAQAGGISCWVGHDREGTQTEGPAECVVGEDNPVTLRGHGRFLRRTLQKKYKKMEKKKGDGQSGGWEMVRTVGA
ncbi:hypothetical protein PoB_007488600 [Plakobranchus ocellatus]|uniref:Uncharacterized protein n=1 Tax=Plakobranchus ocellatus TaxID=259542 RepID=A0AAV4DW79_9GAST|nr:hypothetical protein PoB_007488600 [Plakobranchus ocellatus]